MASSSIKINQWIILLSYFALGAFLRNHMFPCQSLLSSASVLDDVVYYPLIIYVPSVMSGVRDQQQ